jgi:hypothetical protein
MENDLPKNNTKQFICIGTGGEQSYNFKPSVLCSKTT